MTTAGFGRLTDSPASVLVSRVRVIDPSTGVDEIRDLGIVDGVLADPGAVPSGALRIDGHGLVAAPGFCDLHAHLREPGDPAAESIDTGTRAAARGGYTTVCAMPNTDPPLDDPARVTAVCEAARDTHCRVRIIAAATTGRDGEQLAPIEALAAAGAAGFSDDGASVPEALAADLLAALAGRDLPLFEHAEDPDIAGAGLMRAGPTAGRLGLPGWPPEAEVTVVERDLALAARTGARVHLTHLSTKASIEAVRRARAAGARVTCDVTPHHLAMADSWVAGDRAFAWSEPRMVPALAFDGSCRVNPPLASRDDAAALVEAVRDGTVDAIATDHAPHPPERKLVPFGEAAPGMIGLEMSLSIGLAAVDAGQLELTTLIAALSTRPAAIIGERRSLEPGEPADVVVFDPRARWRVEGPALASASSNTPLLGMDLPGVVRLTIAGGRITYQP
jgi:dihydroorotase